MIRELMLHFFTSAEASLDVHPAQVWMLAFVLTMNFIIQVVMIMSQSFFTFYDAVETVPSQGTVSSPASQENPSTIESLQVQFLAAL